MHINATPRPLYAIGSVYYFHYVACGDHRGTDTAPPVSRHVQDYSKWSRDLLGGDEKCVQQSIEDA